MNRDIAPREKLQETLRKAGVGTDTTIVIYGDHNNWFAAWGAWVLDVYGLGAMSGCSTGAASCGRRAAAVTADVPSFPASDDHVPRAKREVAAAFRTCSPSPKARRPATLIDIRSPDEYTGKIFAPEGREGVVHPRRAYPGRRNVPWGTIVNDDGTFKPVDEIRAIYAAKGVDGSTTVVTYCRIGERSSHSWFALKRILGYNVRNYDGSWTEYGNAVGVPVTNKSGTIWLGK